MADPQKETHNGKNLHTRTTGKQWGKLKTYARNMRKMPTPAEQILWERLRRKQVGGFKFRRQHPIQHFIVDLYCADARLVIEIDGSIHDKNEQAEYDENRQRVLEEMGIEGLRLSNDEVVEQTDATIEQILEILTG